MPLTLKYKNRLRKTVWEAFRLIIVLWMIVKQPGRCKACSGVIFVFDEVCIISIGLPFAFAVVMECARKIDNIIVSTQDQKTPRNAFLMNIIILHKTMK